MAEGFDLPRKPGVFFEPVFGVGPLNSEFAAMSFSYPSVVSLDLEGRLTFRFTFALIELTNDCYHLTRMSHMIGIADRCAKIWIGKFGLTAVE